MTAAPGARRRWRRLPLARALRAEARFARREFSAELGAVPREHPGDDLTGRREA